MTKNLEKAAKGAVAVFACVFLLSGAAFVRQAQAAEKVLDENLDMKTLKLMAEHGQLIHLSYDGEELTYRTVMMMVDAPLDVVWKVVSDVEKYSEFVPEMESVSVLDRKKSEVTVEHTIKVKIVGPFAATEKYKTRYVFEKPKIYMQDPEKPDRDPGYWELVSTDEGEKTLLIYFDKAPNLNEMNTVVQTLVSTKPELGLAIQVSPVSILAKAMKARSEKTAKRKK